MESLTESSSSKGIIIVDRPVRFPSFGN
jgi:hypothetical protein